MKKGIQRSFIILLALFSQVSAKEIPLDYETIVEILRDPAQSFHGYSIDLSASDTNNLEISGRLAVLINQLTQMKRYEEAQEIAELAEKAYLKALKKGTLKKEQVIQLRQQLGDLQMKHLGKLDEGKENLRISKELKSEKSDSGSLNLKSPLNEAKPDGLKREVSEEE